MSRLRPSSILALLLLAGAGRGSEISSFGEYLEVQLVTVEVFATGPDGAPVLDLRRAEFRVSEDGAPVEITSFAPPPEASEGTAGGSSARRRGAPGGDEGARVAVFVDNLNTGPASRGRVFAQLWETLDQALLPGDQVMLASFDGSLNIRLPFTSDRRKLLEELRRVETLSAGRLSPRIEEQRMLDLIGWHQQQQLLDGRGDPCVHVGNLARQHADAVHSGVLGTLAALSEFVNSLAGIPGRKVLIHVSDGIPLVPGAEAFNYAIELCDGTGANERVEGAIDIDRALSGDGRMNRFNPQHARLDLMQYDTTDLWRRLAAEANAQRVVIYPLFASGLGAPSRSEIDAVRTTFRTALERTNNDQETLALMARETGGSAFLNRNDFRPAFRQILHETRSSYTLAYAAPHPGDGALHSIEVDVDRPGVKLRHRQGYRAKSVSDRVADGVVSALLYGIEANPLGLRVETEDLGVRVARRARVKLRLRLPLDRLTLLPRGEENHGLFTVYVAAREASGAMTPVGRRSIPVRVGEGEAGPRPREFVYEVEMELGPGRNEVAVALRDELGGEVSYLTARVEAAAG